MNIVIGGIVVSNKILDHGESPTWMYRKNPITAEDSGWRVFSGTEEDDYLDNPVNFGIVNADRLIKIDDSLKANLFAPFKSSFEKNTETGHWIPIDKG